MVVIKIKNFVPIIIFLLTLTFIILKLCHLVTWSWLIILSPILFFGTALCILSIIIAILDFIYF